MLSSPLPIQNSPIFEHLPVGSVIVRVNGHAQVHTAADWYSTMARETAASFTTNSSVKRYGYCSSVARVEQALIFTPGVSLLCSFLALLEVYNSSL